MGQYKRICNKKLLRHATTRLLDNSTWGQNKERKRDEGRERRRKGGR